MSDNTNVKSVILGWVALATAYVIGRKHGRKDCISDVKDIALKQLIEERKEKEGS